MGDTAVEAKLGELASALRAYGRVLVAVSGGVDSTLLAEVAHRELGSAALAVTAVSPSLAAGEHDAVRSLAVERGWRWRQVQTRELDHPGYVANGGDRCYHCKAELLDVLAPLAAAERAVVLIGTIVDDLGDHRPGQHAARERGARMPLVDAGFTKDDVRAGARRLGLPTWDKPAGACLASRVPYGVPVTLGVLRAVERAEAGLRALGFTDLRVRHYGDLARIEVPIADLDRVVSFRSEVVEAVRSAGYRYVTLDLEGLRSGNLNAALDAGRLTPS